MHFVFRRRPDQVDPLVPLDNGELERAAERVNVLVEYIS